MSRELISKKTRNQFREFLVGWTLREIDTEFDNANLKPDREYIPEISGERRSFVEQFYHALDFSNVADMQKLIFAYENILNTAFQKLPNHHDQPTSAQQLKTLIDCLKMDGFDYQDGKILPTKPEIKKQFENILPKHSVSEITRRNIIQKLVTSNASWAGRLSEIEFLSRLYNLKSLPSTDHRFSTAIEDIQQHRVNNPNDWPDDWIFRDPRFDLLNASDETFLNFLCELVHPAVKDDENEVKDLVLIFNQHLAPDGWEIVPRAKISGKPIFSAHQRILQGSPLLRMAEPIAKGLSADYLTQQITRMEVAIESDTELAIGTAKEFVETICKTILHEYNEAPDKNADLLQLLKKTREKLELLPDDIPDKAKGAETIRRVLNNLGTVGQGLAELRGLYGSGHGKDARAKGLPSRHARLAVGIAATLGIFLFETYQARMNKDAQKPVTGN